MILHCTLPYRQNIPNPALGYLKGFLKMKGIHVQNIYWNLVLARTVLDMHRNLEKYTRDEGLSSIPAISLFVSKHLLTDYEIRKTTLDLLFSSIFQEREILNFVTSVKKQIDQYIQQNNLHKEPLSGFTLKTYQWPMSHYIIQRLKALNPETNIIIGGITNKEQALQFMKVFNLADFAVWGEGEYPLFHLVKALEEGNPLDEVPNLVYRDGNEIRFTSQNAEHSDLDSYPFADHSDFFAAFERYISMQMPILIPIWGSRSCPWNKCKFCVLNEEYTYRTRSPENIVAEIEYQVKRHNVDNFIFVDTELPGNKRRFKTLLNLLVKSSERRKRPYYFFAEISPVFIDSETAHLMQLAFFSSIQIGFEAMTDSLLKKMEKRHRFAHNIQALKLGNQYNLKMDGLNIIREIPTETTEDVIESCINLKFLRFLLSKYPLSPIYLMLCKGSPFYDEGTEEERKSWNSDLFWEEIAPTNLVSAPDRFELFSFSIDSPAHCQEWGIFDRVMTSYTQQNRSYTWTEYPDGSYVEERGPKILRYTFDREETDNLIFCDVIRNISELKTKFPHLSEEKLFGILSSLKEAGFLYFDTECTTIISILEASRRKQTESYGG